MWFSRKSDTNVAFRDVMRRLELLEADHATLLAQHTALRGRVYALWGKGKSDVASDGSGPATPVPHVETIQEVRRRLTSTGRITPGKPTKHEE